MCVTGTWVFGYGSLVSHVSFSDTVGRVMVPGVDFFPAVLAGFGRRWNYGLIHAVGRRSSGNARTPTHTIVALGLTRAESETANGIVGRVSDAELAHLDRRERHYDRIEVTNLIGAAYELDAPVITYVPRAEAIRCYESARDRGVAAIEQRYWDLVDGAFEALGPGERDQYHATTPAPDVPIIEMIRV